MEIYEKDKLQSAVQDMNNLVEETREIKAQNDIAISEARNELTKTINESKEIQTLKKNVSQKGWIKFVSFVYRTLLSVRYDVKVKGVDTLKGDKPTIILPNHPALIDPQILFTQLSKYLGVSPVVTEKYFDDPVLNKVFNAMGAVKMADISMGNTDKAEVTQIFSNITQELNNGKNIMIYPAGQIYSQGHESIIGKQSVYNIIKSIKENENFQELAKNIRILGVKSQGIWGSMWSKAWNGKAPNFFSTYLKGIWFTMANLLFFTPKRKVTIEVQDITTQILENLSDLNKLNAELENFYNQGGEEEIQYVPHYFWYNDTKYKKKPKLIQGSLKQLTATNNIDCSDIDPEIKNQIINKIAAIKEINTENINEKSNLIVDLKYDSLDMAEIKSFVQLNFKGASNPPITDLKTVGDLFMMAIGKSTTIEKLKPCEWGFQIDPTDANLSLQKAYPKLANKDKAIEYFDKNDINILTLLKKTFKEDMNKPFMYDNVLGMQTRREFLIKAYLVSDYIKKIEGKYIGIMLPSLVSSSLLIVATYLAGKVPVMLNWTVSEEGFDHCINFSKTNVILSSSNFFDKVKTPGLEKHNDKFMFLENMLKNVSTTQKLKAFVNAKRFKLPMLDKEAVILYTSGSESLPKAVPLTHMNIIENIRSALSLFNLKKDDTLIGFLPPFHSFGFTVNTIMPLITGIKVAYTPDPNDSKTIVELIKHTDATALAATPTFLKMIMDQAGSNDLKSLKYAVVGAEKCPESVFEQFNKLNSNKAQIIEGYGITECSPVITINPFDKPKKGSVGKPIEGLDIKILSLDNDSKCEHSENGMIYVSANSIFDGYMDSNIDNPFIEIDGKSYYKTGDLGYLDDEGYLFITGRLKRFIKIAGEMISLPFIEEVLNQKYGTEIAIEALEKDGKAKIVLFTLNGIDIKEANDYLRQRGVNNLVKISQIENLEKLPVLGSWKMDYKTLKNMITF